MKGWLMEQDCRIQLNINKRRKLYINMDNTILHKETAD